MYGPTGYCATGTYKYSCSWVLSATVFLRTGRIFPVPYVCSVLEDILLVRKNTVAARKQCCSCLQQYFYVPVGYSPVRPFVCSSHYTTALLNTNGRSTPRKKSTAIVTKQTLEQNKQSNNQQQIGTTNDETFKNKQINRDENTGAIRTI